jgi:hypothetical protein
MIHQINRLTGRTGITQLTHSLVINPMPSRRYKYIYRSITAKRAFDINPMPSERILTCQSINIILGQSQLTITAKRAFQGMAGLAVLYPSVVDWMYRS